MAEKMEVLPVYQIYTSANNLDPEHLFDEMLKKWFNTTLFKKSEQDAVDTLHNILKSSYIDGRIISEIMSADVRMASDLDPNPGTPESFPLGTLSSSHITDPIIEEAPDQVRNEDEPMINNPESTMEANNDFNITALILLVLFVMGTSVVLITFSIQYSNQTTNKNSTRIQTDNTDSEETSVSTLSSSTLNSFETISTTAHDARQDMNSCIIILGGEINDRIQKNVFVYENSSYSDCFPPLKLPVKHGAAAILNNVLIICGGETKSISPTNKCYKLVRNTEKKGVSWVLFHSLDVARSQSAYTATNNNSLLLIISGHNRDFFNYSIPNMELVSLNQKFKLFETTSQTRFASAVTLKSQDILVTGGLHTLDQVTLIKGPEYHKMEKRKSMIEGRYWHASAHACTETTEIVIVAGGVDSNRNLIRSVERYKVDLDEWANLLPLPEPRKDFTLYVSQGIQCIANHENIYNRGRCQF